MNVCRITDVGIGTCCEGSSHSATGKIISGAGSVYAEGLQVARSGDIVVSDCHGRTGKIIANCSVYAENQPVACIGDYFTGCFSGKLISGAGSVYAGSAFFVAGTSGQRKFKVKALNLGPSGGKLGPAYVPQPPKTEKADETPAPAESTPPVTCLTVSDPPPDNFQLSPNFVLSDLSTRVALPQARVRVSSQAGLTTQQLVCNLQGWCENVGEALVAQYGKSSMTITSGFRRGSGSSQHHRGQAVDVQFLTKTNPEVWEVALWVKVNIPFDQLIIEYGGNRPWLHISYNRDGNRPATAGNKFGTQNYGNNYTWGSLELKYGNDGKIPTKLTT